MRLFKWDKHHRLLGSRIPNGASVEVIRVMPRRRVIVQFRGEIMTTMLWCLTPHKIRGR